MQSAFSKLCARLEKISGAWPYWRDDFRRGRKRKIEALREIAEAESFDSECRDLAREALREVGGSYAAPRASDKCPECRKWAPTTRCSCGCGRRLCRKCADTDQVMNLILQELSS